jgi:hypothetical protein
MRVIWEEEDIKPGLKVQKIRNNSVGFIAEEKSNNFRLICLSSGYCSPSYTKEEILHELNNCNDTFTLYR